ncbi:hypothetical protein [Pseudoteredinibacter isoporae]|uniref:hypothetical protein n=1 Tax=Pseudoteredinibacter isoporae TaxID=570281 RepID=UPI003105D714
MNHHDFLRNDQVNELSSKQRKQERKAATEFDDLNNKLERLNLYVLALGELLGDLGVSKETIEKKIEEIDLRDGKRDGKFSEVSICTNCRRKTAVSRPYCMYCGASF